MIFLTKQRTPDTRKKNSRLFEIALVLVRFDHFAGGGVNADHSIGSPAVVHRVAECIIGRAIPQPTEWQRIGN
jgi:hypothetical protein